MTKRLSGKRSSKAGAAPGTLMHIGDRKTDRSQYSIMAYDETRIDEHQTDDLAKALSLLENQPFAWLNVDGIHDTEMISRIGQRFNIHPLTQEDILNTAQRPKVEAFENYIYLVIRMLHYKESGSDIISEQVSMILTPNALISFQESPGDVFAPVRERLQKGRGRIRTAGGDYLMYTLIDAVVDHYFVILERVGLEIDDLEEATLSSPGSQTLERLHDLKREVIALRKQIWPLRELIASLTRGEAGLIQAGTIVFLRDVYDHTIQVIDTIESFRDLLSGLLDLHLSTVSNKMNEVMKVLTVIATIFIPLTFIVGIYGMNFKYMPELRWYWGYGLIWVVMIAIAVLMLFFFKKKKWL